MSAAVLLSSSLWFSEQEFVFGFPVTAPQPASSTEAAERRTNHSLTALIELSEKLSVDLT